MSRVELESGQVLVNVHDEGKCAGEYCTIHNPSDHSMRDLPRWWREDGWGGFMERLCPHGVGHPDPDDSNAHPSHGCCHGRCCA